MESLKTLATSLESNTSNVLEENEKNLTRDFRAAALSLTTLYKTSIEAHKRSFDSGYSTALTDILQFIQQGVSNGHRQGHPSGMDGDGMTIGRVMDFLEARLEAISSQEEDVQSDDDKTVKRLAPTPNNSRASISPDHIKEKSTPVLQAPLSNRNRSPTPTMQSTTTSPNLRGQALPLPRRTKGRARSKESNVTAIPFSQSAIGNTNISPSSFSFTVPDPFHRPEPVTVESSGSYHGLGKRRHTAELENAFTLPVAPTSQGARNHRRRAKHGHGQGQGTNAVQQHHRMEVEDDGLGGRERKRLARRDR